MPQNFLYPQRDHSFALPVDMREWLPEDDLVYVVLDAVATLDLAEFYGSYRADGHGRAAFGPEMMVALLLYAYSQGEWSSRVIEQRCVRDVAYRVITGGLRPDHATVARFRAGHQQALGELFSQVLRLLAAKGMVPLGKLSLDGTKLDGNAAQKASHTLPQIEKLLAEAAAVDAAEDAQQRDNPRPTTPRALARRAERLQRLAAARDRQRSSPRREPALPPCSAAERHLVDRFTQAFEAADIDGILALHTEDVWLTMPPLPLEYQGPELAGQFLAATAFRPGWTARLIPPRANGQPAFGFYACDPHTGRFFTVGLMVLTLSGTRISAMARFDASTLPRFGLPATLAG